MDKKQLIKKIYYFLNRVTGIGYYWMIYKGRRISGQIGIKKEEHYFVCSHGIGDVVWMLSFINEYLDRDHIPPNSHIICCKRDINLVKIYLEGIDVIGIDKKKLVELGHYGASRSCRGRKIHVLIFPTLRRPNEMARELRMMSNIGMEMDLCYKYGCFDLDSNAEIRFPDLSAYVNIADEIIYQNKIVIGKTVVLVPFVNSRLALPVSDWEKIAYQLSEQGFDVYTNVGADKDVPIRGTRALSAPLEALPLIIQRTGCAVTGRCGLADWIFVNGCNMAVIHVYKTKIKLRRSESIQSSFARKESFANMKRRCKIENGELVEYRMNQDGDNNDKIKKLTKDVKKMLKG